MIESSLKIALNNVMRFAKSVEHQDVRSIPGLTRAEQFPFAIRARLVFEPTVDCRRLLVTGDEMDHAPGCGDCIREEFLAPLKGSLTSDSNLGFAAAHVLQEVIDRVRRACLLYTSPSPRDRTRSRMPSSA